MDEENVKRQSCARRFRLRRAVYLSEMEVTIPVVLKTDANYFVKRDIVANVISSDEVNFLCGRKTIIEWKTKVDYDVVS